ncbi:MAG: phosphoesterase PA-phosphatase related protein [Gemmatimonadetes bacterium]|nr:phosphoesterase PA-phosphatase related protein [Gemmatimonadota bacterium]
MRRTTAFLLAGTLLLGAPASLFAQADTIHARKTPLFTLADAALFGGFALATVAVAPLDRHYSTALQNPSRQADKFYTRTATIVRTVADPGAIIIGVSMYTAGRLTHNAKAADLGWHGTEAVIAGGALGALIKGLAGRARPYKSAADPNPHDYQFLRGFSGGSDYQSFPSGHTIAAFAAASAVSSETSRWWPNSRWLIGPVMYGGASLVGVSRMYNNKHWASDVMTGALIGTFAGLKTVRYHHTHPGNRLDRWMLGASITPRASGGSNVSLTLTPQY